MTQILQLAPRAPKTAPRPKSRKVTRALRRQVLAATALGATAATLTALSLSHLAAGIEIVTAAPSWEAWAMAIGIDCGFVTLELANLTIGEKLRRQIARYTRPATVGTLSGSAALNALVFASGAHGLLTQAAAIIMGVAIPALIYAMTRGAAAIYIDTNNRA